MDTPITLVTGGTSGLGLAIVRLFVEKGHTVVAAARNRSRFEAQLGSEHERLHFIATDVSRADDQAALHTAIRTRFGRLDVAVNNAGLAQLQPLAQTEEADFDRMMNVNVKSIWLGMKHQIALMQQGDGAAKHIINVSSINGLGGAPMAGLYSATKAAVIALTKTAAQEVAGTPISINALAPGPFDTPMLDAALSKQAGGSAEQKQALIDHYQRNIPRGRFGDPAELARTVWWLTQSDVPYLTGQTLVLDGGLTSSFR